MSKKYVVRLTEEERSELETLIKKGQVAAYKRLHAQVLLKADISVKSGGWTDQQMSEALDISTRTVEHVRQRLVEGGLSSAINRAPRSGGYSTKLDGEQEAHLIALSCQEPPAGRGRWTLRLLADKMVELHYVESLSHETVRQTLKKTR